MMRLSSSWRRLYSCIRIPGGESKYLWVAAFNLDDHRFAHAPASLPTVVPGAYCCSYCCSRAYCCSYCCSRAYCCSVVTVNTKNIVQPLTFGYSTGLKEHHTGVRGETSMQWKAEENERGKSEVHLGGSRWLPGPRRQHALVLARLE